MISLTGFVVTKVSPCVELLVHRSSKWKIKKNKKCGSSGENAQRRHKPFQNKKPRQRAKTEWNRPCRWKSESEDEVPSRQPQFSGNPEQHLYFLSSSPSKNSRQVNPSPAEINDPTRPSQSHCPSPTAESLRRHVLHSGRGCTLLRWRTGSRRDTCGGAATWEQQQRKQTEQKNVLTFAEQGQEVWWCI